MSQLCVPNTNLKITDGSVVQLCRFPGMKWVVHEGWYTYNGQQLYGWYFSSIPAKTIIPVTDADLRTLQFVSTSNSSDNSGDCGCTENKPPHPPDGSDCYPPGHPNHMTEKILEQVSAAWITVDTIAQRNKLNTRFIPEGKIVRVNQVKDSIGPKYYEWNAVEMKWDEFYPFSNIDTSDFVTKEKLTEEVNSAIAKVDFSGIVSEEIGNSTAIDDKIKKVADEVIPEQVQEASADLEKRIKKLEDDQKLDSSYWTTLEETETE